MCDECRGLFTRVKRRFSEEALSRPTRSDAAASMDPSMACEEHTIASVLLHALTCPDGTAFSFEYDNLGRLVTIPGYFGPEGQPAQKGFVYDGRTVQV